MAYTAPRTWVTSEVVTAAMLNTHLRDNMIWAASFHGCRAYKSAAQTVAIGANDAVTFNSEEYDTDTMHNTGATTSRFVAPVAGYYRAHIVCAVDADGSNHNGRMVVNIRKNAGGVSGGGTSLTERSWDAHASTQSAAAEWTGFLSAAEYTEAFFQSTVEARDLTATIIGTAFTFTFVGF